MDAEPIVRSTVQSILERAGYQVTGTDSVDKALAVIRMDAPDLLITNVSLPGITGHEAMRKFREENSNIPVLMVSGLPDSQVIREWVTEIGFDAFPKPFAASQLVEKVRNVLARKQARSDARA